MNEAVSSADGGSPPALPGAPVTVVRDSAPWHTRRRVRISAGIGLFVGIALFLISGTGIGFRSLEHPPEESAIPQASLSPEALKAQRSLQRLTPPGPFIVIDRVRNRLYLREGDEVLLEAVISAGSGSVLEDPLGKRTWTFDTPPGRLHIRSKRTNPLWTAPDWEYIETGEPIPRNHADRVFAGMLGEYALDLGGGPQGYMIHGTLYTRLLGRNVSHGCIRVGRDDLRVLWKRVPVGATVFIY